MNIAAFGSAFLFALGLGISGMTNPQKVIGFLDFLGAWDPSLAFVMAGAIAVHLPVYLLQKRLRTPALAPEWYLPSDSKISWPYITGPILFGTGWGIAGYCPGPALVSLASLRIQPLLFVASMLAGMFLIRKIIFIPR